MGEKKITNIWSIIKGFFENPKEGCFWYPLAGLGALVLLWEKAFGKKGISEEPELIVPLPDELKNK